MTMSERKSAVSRWSLNSCFQLGRQGYSITLTVFIFRVIIVYNYKAYSSIYTHYFNSNIDTCSLLLEIRERPSQSSFNMMYTLDKILSTVSLSSTTATKEMVIDLVIDSVV